MTSSYLFFLSLSPSNDTAQPIETEKDEGCPVLDVCLQIHMGEGYENPKGFGADDWGGDDVCWIP